MKYDDYGIDAERLFVKKGKTLSEIAQLLPVNIKTLSNWKRKYDWSGKRKAYLRGPIASADKIAEILSAKLEKIDPQTVDAKQVDQIIKLVASMKKLDKSIDRFGISIDLVDDLLTYLKRKNKKLMADLVEALPGFWEEMKEKYR